MKSRFLRTPELASICRLRAEGVSGERGAAERGGASDELRARGHGGEQRARVPPVLPGGFKNGGGKPRAR